MTKRIRIKEKLGTYNVKKLTKAKKNNKNLFESIKEENIIKLNGVDKHGK